MISAVIVNHKTSIFLPALINSLKKEKVDEIIVVDNSQDNNEKKKIELLNGISSYFLNENKGLGQALNFGSRKAKGDLLLFCNPDILFKSSSIELLKKGIEKCDAAGPAIFWDKEEEFFLPYPFPENFYFELLKIFLPKMALKIYLKYEFKIWETKKMINLPLLSGSCFLIKKNAFEKVGGFDENFFLYFEENDFFKRLKKMGFKSNFIPSSKVIHFFNIKKIKNHVNFFEASKKLYEKKHFSFIQRMILNFLKNKIRLKEKKFEDLKEEKIIDLPLILSPFPSFIPAVYLKKQKNFNNLKEKLKKLNFNEGYIGIVMGKKIKKVFKFSV